MLIQPALQYQLGGDFINLTLVLASVVAAFAQNFLGREGTQTLIDEFHRRSMAVIAWTVDDPDRARELAGWGVDAITTNTVDPIRAALSTA